MTTITEGMTPAQFVTAINSNITEVSLTGESITFSTALLGHQIKTGYALNSLGDIPYGTKGQNIVNTLNNKFATDLTADIVMAGVTDVKDAGAVGNGVADDQAAINAAVALGNIIIQNGTFKISASIKIPSNRTVYLKNCILKMANASYDNFFRNNDLATGNSNIRIIGLGNAELNGNSANNSDNYANYGPKNTVAPFSGTIYRYNGIIFCQVDIFEISGIYFNDLPHWGTYLQKSTNGSFHDIYHNDPTSVLNQDCVNLCHGCNNVDVYNISSLTHDDFGAVAVANYSDMAYTEFAGWNEGDVHDINFHDIVIYDAIAFTTFLSGDGGKIYNIDFKDITIRDAVCLYRGFAGFCDVEPAKTDNYNITMDRVQIDSIHVEGAYGNYCFEFQQSIMDFTATNVINDSGKAMYRLSSGDQSDSVTINGVQVT